MTLKRQALGVGGTWSEGRGRQHWWHLLPQGPHQKKLQPSGSWGARRRVGLDCTGMWSTHQVPTLKRKWFAQRLGDARRKLTTPK